MVGLPRESSISRAQTSVIVCDICILQELLFFRCKSEFRNLPQREKRKRSGIFIPDIIKPNFAGKAISRKKPYIRRENNLIPITLLLLLHY